MADQQELSSRAIMGMYYRLLEQDPGVEWVNGISNMFASDQASETYKFLGQAPVLREWIAGRQAKSLVAQGVTLTNVHYEATLEIRKPDARRDKTPQISARLAEMVQRQNSHWATLLSALLVAGEVDLCYDGQAYFDTDHTEAANTSNQSNDLAITISGIPAQVTGSSTNPSNEEMQGVILRSITAMMGFVDDQGEPMNENASEFTVMVIPALWPAAVAATQVITTGAMIQNVNPNLIGGMKVTPVMNTRLTSATSKVYTFRTDSAIKPLIRQSEMDSVLRSKAEGSEFEFDNDAWQFGIDSWRTVGYGYWQHACLATMS